MQTNYDDEMLIAAGEMDHGRQASVYCQLNNVFGKMAASLHNAASVVSLLFMTVCITTEVIMRYLFNSALYWSQEACGIGLFVLVLCCQADCWQRDRHIRMDLLYNAAPSWFKKTSDFFTVACGAVFYGTICAQAVLDLPYQFAVNESTDELHLPMWILNCVMITGSALVLALLTSHTVNQLRENGRDRLI